MKPTDLFINKRIVCMDIETTGLDMDFDRIIELGVVEYFNGEKVLEHSRLFGGGRSNLTASQVHGIKDVDRAGLLTFEDCSEDVCKYLSNAILVGHNLNKFDIPMVRKKLERAGHNLTGVSVIDTYLIAKRLKLPSKSLENLCKHYGVEHGHHRGLGDALSSWGILLKMVDEMKIIRLEEILV